MSTWLLHIEDGVREQAHRMVEQVRSALLNRFPEFAPEDGGGRLRAAVSRAVVMNGARRSVRIELHDGLCSILAPGGRSNHHERFSFHGPTPASASAVPERVVLEALTDWRDRLAAPQSGIMAATALRVRQELRAMLAGVVEMYDETWTRATGHFAGRGRHSITVRRQEDRRGALRTFQSGEAGRAGGTMTPQLVTAFDEILGDRVHVSEGHARSPTDMPSILVGHAPFMAVDNRMTAVERLQVLAAVPVGARLIDATR